MFPSEVSDNKIYTPDFFIFKTYVSASAEYSNDYYNVAPFTVFDMFSLCYSATCVTQHLTTTNNNLVQANSKIILVNLRYYE